MNDLKEMAPCSVQVHIVDRLLTFRQGLEDTSKDALKARRCCVVKMVRGRLDLLCSLLSSPAFPPMELLPPSSSSLFTAQEEEKEKVLLLLCIVFLLEMARYQFIFSDTDTETSSISWYQYWSDIFLCKNY